MYLLTKSETLGDNVSVTFTGGTGNANIIDANRDTFAETTNTAPNLTIDLGTPTIINSLWIEGQNLQSYTLRASANNITYTNIQTGLTASSGLYTFVNFTNATAYRYWRLTFSARGASDPNYRVAEVYLMRMVLDLNTDAKKPYILNPALPNHATIAYRLWNQDLVTYRRAGAVDKATITLEWGNVDEAVVDDLFDVWNGSPHNPELTVYPRPTAEPSKIYQAKWVGDFLFRNTRQGVSIALDGTETVTQYKTGQAVFQEL